MAWDRGAATPSRQHEPVIEPRSQSLHPEHVDTRRRELKRQRQRDAVELAADVCHDRSVGVGEGSEAQDLAKRRA